MRQDKISKGPSPCCQILRASDSTITHFQHHWRLRSRHIYVPVSDVGEDDGVPSDAKIQWEEFKAGLQRRMNNV